MSRMRVHELAKELNMNNKDLIERLLKLGVQVKNHMSTLTELTVQKVRTACRSKDGEGRRKAHRQSRHSQAQTVGGRRIWVPANSRGRGCGIPPAAEMEAVETLRKSSQSPESSRT